METMGKNPVVEYRSFPNWLVEIFAVLTAVHLRRSRSPELTRSNVRGMNCDVPNRSAF
jgi:hypothetical protein